ncbi:AI-2E family transporter [Agromyces badenianii]|uniref:AI-2E family transporter n=1 Tax=Agromyces badenianii TaxID=2080742 RepID=UPI000D599CAE|nr:AI-2E family transporter [Agromyces badenianii]PWC05517.1 AI-2E family transporter [Agromyces badenianii]
MGDAAATDAPARVDRPGLAHGTRVLLTLAAAVIVFAGIWFARDILAPAAVAAVVVIIAHPVRHPLERRGWPSWLATTAVIVVAYLILAALGTLLVVASAQFIAMLPDYADELAATVQAVSDWLASLGLSSDAASSAASAVDPEALLSIAAGVADAVLGTATAFFFVLAYVIFMAADASRLGRDGRVFGTAAADAIGTHYFSGVRRYYVVNATFGLIVAVLDGLLLWAIGVPIPIVWAILAFVTNFIPNIGFVIGVIPPAVLALVVGGWPLALVVVLAYSVINVVLQVLVQPKFVSDAVGLSLALTFFSVVFWTLVIGPIGAILCIPLTLLVRALLLEPDPRAGALRRLSGDPQAVA